MKTLNRRDFLKTSGAAAVFAATPGLAYSQVVGSAGPFDDYRALVCVFLFGGNDSFNMIVPNTPAEYAAYREVPPGPGNPSSRAIADNASLITGSGLRAASVDGWREGPV